MTTIRCNLQYHLQYLEMWVGYRAWWPPARTWCLVRSLGSKLAPPTGVLSPPLRYNSHQLSDTSVVLASQAVHRSLHIRYTVITSQVHWLSPFRYVSTTSQIHWPPSRSHQLSDTSLSLPLSIRYIGHYLSGTWSSPLRYPGYHLSGTCPRSLRYTGHHLLCVLGGPPGAPVPGVGGGGPVWPAE